MIEEDLSVREYIDSFRHTMEGEVKFILNNDWSDQDNTLDNYQRASLYELQKKFVNIMLDRAEVILQKEKGNPSKSAEEVVKKLTNVGEEVSKRITKYVKNKDWASTFDINNMQEFEKQGEFIAVLNADLEKLKKKLSKLVSKEYVIPLKFKEDGQCISLAMRDTMEAKFPIVAEYMEVKMAPQKEVKKTRKKKNDE